MTQIMNQPTRFVYQWWPRHPKGPTLRKEHAPTGYRTPNRIIWGHSVGDFYFIQRVPNTDVVTIWSRSMIKEFGENHASEAFEMEPHPRKRRPWPLLKLPKGPTLDYHYGIPDEGSEHGGCYERIVDDEEEEDHATDRPLQDRHEDLKTEVTSAHEGDHKVLAEMPPALEEFIPNEYFPDILLVEDTQRRAINLSYHVPDGETRTKLSSMPLKYRRVLPSFEDPESTTKHQEGEKVTTTEKGQKEDKPARELRVARLRLQAENKLGSGHHSDVYLAPLELPKPLAARTPSGAVAVAAKLAYPRREARTLLENEGSVYDAFPRHLQEEWCGYNLVPPIKHPVPVGAVVPKFFGYYKPIFDPNDLHVSDEIKQEMRHCIEGLSPILLMEHCGQPIESSGFSYDDKMECFSLLQRLHHEDFLQNSFYKRNILVQPGPLTVPPVQRSLKRPSFRIIDFGRTEDWGAIIDKVKRENSAKDVAEILAIKRDALHFDKQHESKGAWEELSMDDYNY